MHPGRDELTGLLLGTLIEEDADIVADHIEQCPDCEETVRELETMSDQMIRALRQPVIPHPLEQESQCQRLLELVEAIGIDRAADHGKVAAPDGELGTIRDYRLVAKLGEGGMGTVYKALHQKLDKIVALKVLPRERTKDPAAVERFEREMKAVGRLSHQNIVGAHDAGEYEKTHFLVMEYVDGVDLSRLAHHIGSLPVPDACELVRQAAIGLQHAHENGLVHRDIKPSNLMTTREGQLKILDLGLARLHCGAHGELTSTGQMMGTIDYMAPEQTGDSHDVDIRADIYGLGATLFKLLCDRTPYADAKLDTIVQKLNALATQPVPAVQEHREEVPDTLAAIVTKMLAKNAEDRYGTPQDVADALAPFARGSDLQALMTRHEQERPADRETADRETADRVPAESSRGSTNQFLSASMTDTHSAPSEDLAQPAIAATIDCESVRDAAPACSLPGRSPATQRTTFFSVRRTAIATLTGGILCVLLYASGAFSFRTANGTITIIIPEKEKVTVLVDGVEAKVTYQNGGREVTLTVTEGDHDLLVRTADGVELKTADRFTFPLGRGQSFLTAEYRKDADNQGAVKNRISGGLGPAQVTTDHREETAQPINRIALVTKPARLPGVKTWTIETRDSRSSIEAFDFHPITGDVIAATLADGAIRVYNAEDGTFQRALLPGDALTTRSVRCSPDGKTIAAVGVNTGIVQFWDDATGRRLHAHQLTSPTGEAASARELAWSPDSATVAVIKGKSGEIQLALFHLPSKTLVQDIFLGRGDSQLQSEADFSPDGRHIAVSGKGAGIFDAATGELVRTLPSEKGLWSVDWSPKGHNIATITGDGLIEIVNAVTGEVEATRQVNGACVNQVVWSPEGDRLFVHSSQPVVLDASLATVLELPHCNVPSLGQNRWSQRGDTLGITTKDGLQVFDARNGNPTRLIRHGDFENTPSDLEVSPDGELLAVGMLGNLVLMDPATGEIRHHEKIQGFDQLAWSPDSQSLAGHSLNSRRLQIWDATGKFVSRALPGDSSARALAWSPDGRFIVESMGEENAFRVVDAASGHTLYKSDQFKDSLKDVAISPDSRRLAVKMHGPGVSVHDLQTGKRIETYEHSWGCSVEYRRTGEALASGGRILRSGRENALPFDGQISAWSDNGESLCAISIGDWTSTAGIMIDEKVSTRFDVPYGFRFFSINSIEWLLGDRFVVVDGIPGQVAMFDVNSGEHVRSTLLTATGPAVSISADGHFTGAKGSEDHLVYVVELDDGSCETLAPNEFSRRFNWKNDPDRVAVPPANRANTE